ncbi:hypothetical protein LTR95_002419 [Oleoguttula sp. CCFEE 5521]
MENYVFPQSYVHPMQNVGDYQQHYTSAISRACQPQLAYQPAQSSPDSTPQSHPGENVGQDPSASESQEDTGHSVDDPIRVTRDVLMGQRKLDADLKGVAVREDRAQSGRNSILDNENRVLAPQQLFASMWEHKNEEPGNRSTTKHAVVDTTR